MAPAGMAVRALGSIADPEDSGVKTQIHRGLLLGDSVGRCQFQDARTQGVHEFDVL